LREAEIVRTDPIGWNLKDIFKKRDSPTDNDSQYERSFFVLEVPVPGYGHEGIGNG
jgi:hypothetical protein